MVVLGVSRGVSRRRLGNYSVYPRRNCGRRPNVRLWLLADIHPHSDLRPLYPRKQTCFAVLNYGQFCPSIFFEIFEFPCGHLEGSKCPRAGGGPRSRSRVRSHPRQRHVTPTTRRRRRALVPAPPPGGCPSRVESAANCTLAVRSYTGMFPGVFAVYFAV